MSDEPTGRRPWRNFYGRRHGKKLRPGQQALIGERLADWGIPGVGWEENPERAPLDLGRLFPDASDVWLEIGFGGGEHMVAMAAAYPSVHLVGCEPYINGVAMLLGQIERSGVRNLSVLTADARDLLDVLPQRTIGRVFLNYPDPWPKARHHKRRFVSRDNLDALARVMKDGAQLRLATDIPDYARHAIENVRAHKALSWQPRSAADWRTPWPDWPGTRYERKAIAEDRVPIYLTFWKP